MCHSDVGLITFEWSPSYSIPIVNPTTQTCVNWEALQEWAGERAVEGMQKSGYLIHPQTSLFYRLDMRAWTRSSLTLMRI